MQAIGLNNELIQKFNDFSINFVL